MGLTNRRTVPHDSLIDVGIVLELLVFPFQQRDVTGVISARGPRHSPLFGTTPACTMSPQHQAKTNKE